jgi:D-alanyl-D-alanine carboxypeptidase
MFENGYGYADEEWSAHNSPSTKFRIASLTKQFTGASILLLQERGLLRVKEAASKYVSDLPSAWQPITIHQLLTHTSGIPNYVGLPRTDEYYRTGATPRAILDMATNRPLEFTPGSQLRYTNTGYVLLGMIIEKVSRGSYEQFLMNNIFGPLGMVNSGYDHASTILKGRASGYMMKDGHLVNADFVDMSFPYAAGGIYSTAGDIYLWNEGLANGKLLSESSTQQMFAKYPETLLQGMHYGYGVVIAERFGRLLYYHGGGVQGFETAIQRYPEEHLCIVVLENLDPTKPWDLADHIAADLFSELPSAAK